ncbi:MAG: ADP-glyceromanno-heptose 6-epimerase [Candidatus Omnitrophica bacterium]|nr:ADP-glyceromanno-heptose 6-epimerase [Candidatus Omnitrophota bacterium]
MIIVTGAAGFIGSCIVAQLNKRGEKNICVVDHLEGKDDLKRFNLEHIQYARYVDKTEFLNEIVCGSLSEKISAIIHMGACSSTTLTDAQYFKENNLEYTRTLAQYALERGIRFIYASSAATYGDGSIGYKDDEATIRHCRPLNLYGQSKQDFDLWALDNGCLDKIVGIKFFNVFGPNEYHKGDMRSVVAKAYQRVVEEGKMSLFKSYHPKYSDGEQKRDFIYVKDAVDAVLFFYDQPHVNGIFNLGTGQARTWNDLAYSLFKAVGKKSCIEYIDMPESLRDKYQYFTQADMAKLRASGYSKKFLSLEESIADYAKYLKDHRYL